MSRSPRPDGVISECSEAHERCEGHEEGVEPDEEERGQGGARRGQGELPVPATDIYRGGHGLDIGFGLYVSATVIYYLLTE